VLALRAHGAQGVVQILSGHPFAAARSLYYTMRDLGIRNDAELNKAVADLLTDIGIVPQVGPEGQIIIPPRLPGAPQ
jgi:fructose-bisphosphate aldolase class 1